MLLEIEFLSGRLSSVRVVVSLGLMIGVPWLTERSRKHIKGGVVVGRRLIGDNYRVALRHAPLVYVDS